MNVIKEISPSALLFIVCAFHSHFQLWKYVPVSSYSIADKTIFQGDVEPDVDPDGVIWVDMLIAKFTQKQLDILHSQMVQHVQLLTTSTLMCYGTNLLDHISNGCTENLVSYSGAALDLYFMLSRTSY